MVVCGCADHFADGNTWLTMAHLDSLLTSATRPFLIFIAHTQRRLISPTLASPVGTRQFIYNITKNSPDPVLITTLGIFLLIASFIATYLASQLSRLNITCGLIRLVPTQDCKVMSPVAVCIIMTAMFGNIPLISFLHGYQDDTQYIVRPVLPGKYEGVMAHALDLLVTIELITFTLFMMSKGLRALYHCRTLAYSTKKPVPILSWFLQGAGFALRIRLTRRSIYATTSHISKEETVWVWRKRVLHTAHVLQSTDEVMDDLLIWSTYFLTTFILSSFLIYYLNQRRGECL
jgi:hypothetical protein